MRYSQTLAIAMIALGVSLAAAGCLSIGSKTYQGTSSEYTRRLDKLEQRVSELEMLLQPIPVELE